MDGAVRKIIHVDMDAFYASVEQRDDPSLCGRPVAVGHGAARGVVAAASYEARAFGVHSAMASVTALRKCPELVFVRPRFDVYRAVSAQIREIFAEYTDLIEPLSLDEAYLDVTANRRGLPTASETARDIRARIKAVTGLNASAGISYCKFLAKLASDQRKPNGQFVIPPERGEAFIAALPVKKFHGIGPKTAERMNALGIFTGADLRARPLSDLQQHFGKSGAWYYAISRGEDHRAVDPNRIRKSSGSETTFKTDLTRPEDIEAGLRSMADEIWGWCEQRQMFGRTVTVKIKYADFQQATRSRTLAAPVATRELLHSISVELVRAVYPPRLGIRLLGVAVSSFDGEQEGQSGPSQLGLDLGFAS
ncbi:MAG: DNA polymerase IV [Aliidongia sp.]